MCPMTAHKIYEHEWYGNETYTDHLFLTDHEAELIRFVLRGETGSAGRLVECPTDCPWGKMLTSTFQTMIPQLKR